MLSRQQHYDAAADQRNDYEQRIDDDYQAHQQHQQQQQQREGATPQDPITIDSRDDVDHQSSFGLLNHSFDTLSETGTSTSLRLSPCNESDLRRSFEMSPLSSSIHHHHNRNTTNNGNNNIVAVRGEPLTTQPPPPPSEQQLLGDISPIKVTYGRHHRTAQPLFGETSVMPDEWQQHDRDIEEPDANVMTGGATAATPTTQQQQQQQQEKQPSPLPVTANTKTKKSTSDPMKVLQAAKHNFCHMKYLLSSLKTTTTTTVTAATATDENCAEDRTELYNAEASDNKKIALRRVEAAICAFGGRVQRRIIDNETQQQRLVARPSSIFRPRELRQHYEKTLQSRYRMKGSGIQWEVEENPPVEIHLSSSSDDSLTTAKKIKRAESNAESENGNHQKRLCSKNSPTPSHATKSPAGSHETRSSLSAAAAEANINNKMKYHCKRCGQLKQNHVCPYRQPLQRSIGVMVYPAVNSYTAAEPGTIAAPLAKMNNFVSYDESAENQPTISPKSSSMENNYCHSTYSQFPRSTYFPSAITPESQQGGLLQSPQSSLSIQSSEDRDERGIKRSFGSVRPATNSEGGISSLFVETVALKSEHYRAVTQPSEQGDQDADVGLYNYPSIAVSFAERKRLSDTLFYLSKGIPSLVDDCSRALRDARQCFDWDLAVSQLLTQVVVGLYCEEDDTRLDGLQQYLLSLGVSC